MIIALRTLAAALVALTLSLAFGETPTGDKASASSAAPICQAMPCN